MSEVIRLRDYSIEFRQEWDRKRYCRRCSIPMHKDSLGDYRCVSCGKKELNDYHKIKEFLEKNEVANTAVIEEATGVPSIIIKELHANGVIEYAEGGAIAKKCRICGKPIVKDTVCRSCYEKSLSGLQKSSFIKKTDDEPAPAPEQSEAPDLSDPAVRMHAWVRRKK